MPVSLLGTFGGMYLLGYSLDNLSLMALTIATGFVVDDAIVVLENISRHIEAGMPRFQAALQGAREVGFTVLSMSISLIAVFLPILLMGGIVGRLFREFAVTLSMAILVSLVVSLTTTPMMCARVLAPPTDRKPGRFSRIAERCFDAALRGYDRTLQRALAHPLSVVLLLLMTLCFNVYLFVVVPKGFFPQEDTGRLIGGIQADQSISFQLMRQKLTQFIVHRAEGPAVAQRGGLHRRRPDQRRLRLHLPEAAGGAQVVRGSGHRAAAPRAVAGSRRRLFLQAYRTSASAAGRATRSTSTRSRATISLTSSPGCRRSPRHCSRYRS